MSTAFDKAKNIERDEEQKELDVKIVLYIGIFFDGTNNNKTQAMVGQFFRRKEIYKKHKIRLKKCGVNSLAEMLKHDRTFWEKGEGKGILNISEIDKIYGSGKVAENELDDDASVYGAKAAANYEEKSLGKDKNYKFLQKMSDLSNQESNWVQDKIAKSLGNGSTYTNVAILSSLFKKNEEEKDDCKIIREFIYIEGSGTDTGIKIWQHDIGSDITGLAFGLGSTGVVAKCREMSRRVKVLVDKYSIQQQNSNKGISLHFQIFGFSRGSTTARAFTYILNPKNSEFVPSMSDYELFTGIRNVFLPLHNEQNKSHIVEKKIDFLGIYDTDSSIGIMHEPLNQHVGDILKIQEYEEYSIYNKSIYHDKNVNDYGLNATPQAENVLHICALDENRSNFAIVDIQNSLGKNGTEIFIPGCHTDVGGGASLGLDGLKVVNKHKITNTEEIIKQLDDIIEVAKGTINTISSAKSTIENIRGVMQGLVLAQTGGGILNGVPLTIKKILATYVSVKETIHNANQTVHKIKDTVCETQEKIEGELQDSVEAQLPKEGANVINNIINKVLDKGGNSAESSCNALKKNDNLMTNGQIIGNLSESQLDKGMLTLPSNESKTFSNAQNTFSAIPNLGNDIIVLSTDVKTSAQGLLEKIKRKFHDLNLIKSVSDTIIDVVKDMQETVKETQDTLGCIKDIIKQPKKRLIDIQKTEMFVYNEIPAVYNTADDVLLGVGEEALKAQGWVSCNVQAHDGKGFAGRMASKELESASDTILLRNTKVLGGTDLQNVGIYKYSCPGYSNVSLKLMYDRSIEEGNVVFEQYPENNYGIPEDLNTFFNSVKQGTKGKQRYICVPKYKDDYRLLRCKYLHFSTNQQLLSLADNNLVNPPSVSTKLNNSKTVIMRRVYSGDGDEKELFLYDYGNNAQTELIIVPCNIKADDKFCVTSVKTNGK